MKTCVWDNQYTARREAWVDGQLVCWVTMMQLEVKGFVEYFRDRPHLFMALNVGPWTPGLVRGDVDATTPAAVQQEVAYSPAKSDTSHSVSQRSNPSDVIPDRPFNGWVCQNCKTRNGRFRDRCAVCKQAR